MHFQFTQQETLFDAQKSKHLQYKFIFVINCIFY